MFRDGDNDGVGDLAGLIAELDYVRLLGVDALWLTSSPPLPHRGVAALVGTPDVFTASGSPALFGLLTREAHRRGLFVLLDIGSGSPTGHATRTDPPPRFGHRAEGAGLGRTVTRAAAPTAPVRRWLELGADAVRAGDAWHTIRVPSRSAPILATGQAAPSVLFGTDDDPGGCPLCTVCADPAHCGAASSSAGGSRWEPRRLVAAMGAGWRVAADAPRLWVLADAGAARASGRLGAGLAQLAATLLLTLPGVSVVTGGDEVGVVDGVPEPGLGRRRGRAGRMLERAPMPWGAGVNDGFAPSPWRALVGGGTAPVSTQLRDPDSLLSFHRRLIALRRNEPTLVRGTARLVLAEAGLLAYVLDGPGSRVLVALNGGPDRAEVPFLRGRLSGHVALATDRAREGLRAATTVALAPHEAVVIRLTA